MDFSDIKENKDIVVEVLDNTKKRDDDYYFVLARINIINRDYKQARDSLEKLEGYVPDSLVFLNIYLGDYKNAIQNLESDKFYPSILTTSITLDAIASIESRGISENDKKVLDELLLKFLTREAYDKKDELYKTAMSKLKNKSAITIVNQIYKDYGWINRY